ncbi:hypothetical protein [Lactiplantibacillus pentosus]|uniref:hypothetical protein n=1 Tax=Lactiplantibacillus pentosus TaxID=1589 RepID=UPI0020A710F3|nr:hypothetical protein [Lactiplantibacillus pentosus]MDY1543851.1 hypothetical protein [Lactiplantibacillus pentosus]
MMINGHGFGPDYLIDAGATLIILIPLFFYILIRQFFNGHVTIVKVSGLIAFFLYVYALLSVTFFPIMVFKWGAKAYQYGFGKQYLANFNVLELFQYAPSQIIGNPHCYYRCQYWWRTCGPTNLARLDPILSLAD